MAISLKELLGESYKDGMTAAEIDAALASVTLPADETSKKEIERLTAALSKSNAEAAENKRKLREKQTEEEKQKEEQAQQIAAMQEELETLRKDKILTANKQQLVALGYDEALAVETAQAMVNGDTAKLFANQKKFIDAQRTKIKAELMQGTPNPPAGGGTDAITKESYRAMTLDEKQKLARENPTLYQKFNSEE